MTTESVRLTPEETVNAEPIEGELTLKEKILIAAVRNHDLKAVCKIILDSGSEPDYGKLVLDGCLKIRRSMAKRLSTSSMH